MVKNRSHGRRGGNNNQANDRSDENPTRIAARNTDTDSRATNRNEDRARGRTFGDDR